MTGGAGLRTRSRTAWTCLATIVTVAAIVAVGDGEVPTEIGSARRARAEALAKSRARTRLASAYSGARSLEERRAVLFSAMDEGAIEFYGNGISDANAILGGSGAPDVALTDSSWGPGAVAHWRVVDLSAGLDASTDVAEGRRWSSWRSIASVSRTTRSAAFGTGAMTGLSGAAIPR